MHLAITTEEAVAMIPDGARVMLSGFMGVGTPDGLVRALAAAGKKDLTMIVNDAARPDTGVGPLVSAGCVRRVSSGRMCNHCLSQLIRKRS